MKRNAMGAANALIAADMALAGVKSRIPCDEVIEAMFEWQVCRDGCLS
ncbi:UNVERIFIED_CONTAM: L-serine deaminase [Paenibacillus sp. PvR008]